MLDGLKEESVGFLFNVAVEAVPAPQVGPVEEPEGLAEFAHRRQRPARSSRPTAADGAARLGRAAQVRCAPRELTNDEAPELTYSGPSEDGSAQVQGNGGGARRHRPGSPAAPADASGARPRAGRAAAPSRRNR